MPLVDHPNSPSPDTPRTFSDPTGTFVMNPSPAEAVMHRWVKPAWCTIDGKMHGNPEEANLHAMKLEESFNEKLRHLKDDQHYRMARQVNEKNLVGTWAFKGRSNPEGIGASLSQEKDFMLVAGDLDACVAFALRQATFGTTRYKIVGISKLPVYQVSDEGILT